ncbi:hypothetical protein BCR44DRAFT_197237 [Catenaria anguillulae PL171]|uniref:Uncharacterized protein n=1 Tax=Catenaria anguillulae PL171 TaxID=765915 RepID=A0A1Y2HRU6_9FUNG|nr:hypothetical protein BCR44DRAFT_197237 [Catenaria anguillulae PL171]
MNRQVLVLQLCDFSFETDKQLEYSCTPARIQRRRRLNIKSTHAPSCRLHWPTHSVSHDQSLIINNTLLHLHSLPTIMTTSATKNAPSTSAKPAHQVSSSTAADHRQRPSGKVESATCCGCFDMRIGIFLILAIHLILGIYSVIHDLTANTPTVYMRPWETIVSYVLFAISTIVYLVLFYAAAKRIVAVYRPAAKVNVAVVVVSLVLSLALVGMGASPAMNQFEPGVAWMSMAIVTVWFGYWTWVVYKYAEVMEAEVQAKNKSQVMV